MNVRMGAWLLPPVSLLACAALMLGCGSSSSGTSAPDQPLTKSEFIKEAEAICQKGMARKEKAFGEGLEKGINFKAASQAELKEFVELAAVKPYSRLIANLAQLHPANSAKQAVVIVQRYEKGLGEVEADPLGTLESDPFMPGNKAAVAYGIKSCNL